MELERLRSEVETNRQLLATLQKEVTSSNLSQALESSDLGVRIDVVEPAQIPLSPVYPDRMRILGGAFLLGPLIGIGLAFAVDRFGGVIRTVEDAEREIGHPVIGTVPRVEGWGRPGSYLRNHWAMLSIVLVLLLTGVFYAVHGAVQPPTGSAPASSVGRR
jgi:hypothetical protein